MRGAPTTCGASSSSPSPSSESDDEGEEEDRDGDGDDSSAGDAVACGFITVTGVFFDTPASSDEESEESDDEEEDACRRLRFLLRFRGAVGLAEGIWCCC